MNWLRRRKSEPTDGQKAHIEAEKSLHEAQSRWPEVLKVSASLRSLRSRNHFAELIEESMRFNRG